MEKTEYFLRPGDKRVFANLINHLGNLHPGKTWKVTIDGNAGKRTNPQNSLYWKWMEIIGKHYGVHKDDAHREFASQFLSIIDIKTFLTKNKIQEVRSTTTLSKGEFSEYLDRIRVHGLDEGIILPEAEDYGYV